MKYYTINPADVARVVEHGCGDHSCRFVKPTGQGTNGGCRCFDKIPTHDLLRCLAMVVATQHAVLDSRLKRAVEALVRFYVAYHKPEWQEGECADEVTRDVRLLLDEYALDGITEARVPPQGDDEGGPGPL